MRRLDGNEAKSFRARASDPVVLSMEYCLGAFFYFGPQIRIRYFKASSTY